MKDVLAKISSYNIFNYLLPGVVFSVVSDALTSFSLVQDDLIVGFFVYYFVGLVISRIGSLFLEPLMKKVGFLSFSDYKDYVAASQKDEMIKTLSEANNMYRTLCSLFACLALSKCYEWVSESSDFFREWGAEGIVVALFALFAFSYRKQAAYISKRVDRSKGAEDE